MRCLKESLPLINRTKESTHVTWGRGKGGSSFGFGVAMSSKEQWHCCSKWSLSVISWWHINVGPIGLCPSDELSWENDSHSPITPDSHQTCPFGFTFGIMIYAARCPRHELVFCLSAVCLFHLFQLDIVGSICVVCNMDSSFSPWEAIKAFWLGWASSKCMLGKQWTAK